METEILPATEPGALDRAVAEVRCGAVLAFPTDTVYGVGVLVSNTRGIDELYTIKEREATKAIAVLVGKVEDLGLVAGELSPMAHLLAERFWPGPLTLVVPRRPDLPENLSAWPTVGVRMPGHPLALQLLSRTGPMAVTSANRSGAGEASTAAEVYAQLGGRIPLILDGGRTPGGVPSTVVDCTGPQPVILRPGPLTLEQLMRAL